MRWTFWFESKYFAVGVRIEMVILGISTIAKMYRLFRHSCTLDRMNVTRLSTQRRRAWAVVKHLIYDVTQ